MRARCYYKNCIVLLYFIYVTFKYVATLNRTLFHSSTGNKDKYATLILFRTFEAELLNSDGEAAHPHRVCLIVVLQ